MNTSPARPAVLIVNLGSPDKPETRHTRKYLREFLSDRRVIETHPLLWRPIIEGIVLTIRPRKSAAKYKTIWDEGTSPLVKATSQQAEYLQQEFGDAAEVRFAMRYGSNSVQSGLQSLRDEGYRKVLVVPLYPQYAASTTASITDEVARWMLRSRDQFAVRIARSFPTDPKYIDALASALENRWESMGRPNFAEGDRLVLSFHGIPVAMAEGGDPYPQECEATTAALQRRLAIPDGGVVRAYQSKFGPAPWLTPATIDTVTALGALGTDRVDVICPGFVSDCLETLEEIDELNRAAFEDAGGGEFNYVPWGNNSAPWLQALAALVRADLAGWA